MQAGWCDYLKTLQQQLDTEESHIADLALGTCSFLTLAGILYP